MHIEIPVRSPRSFPHVTRSGRHLLRLETLLVSIYYPLAIGLGVGRDPAGYRRWTKEI